MTQLIFTVKSTQVIAGAVARHAGGGVHRVALVALRLSRESGAVFPGDRGVPARVRRPARHLRLPRADRSEHLPHSQPLHDATEPYGPDGIYGQYFSYMLVLLPLAWLAVSSFLRRARRQSTRLRRRHSAMADRSRPTSRGPSSSSSGNTISCSAGHSGDDEDDARQRVGGRAVADAGARVCAGRLHGDGRRARHQKGPLRLARAAGGLSGAARAGPIRTGSPRSRCTSRSPGTFREKRSSAQSNCRATGTAPCGTPCARTSTSASHIP